MNREPISKFAGGTIGYLETDAEGNITVYDFYNRMLGRYNKRNNTTTDFYGRILYFGNMASALILLYGKF